jgi:ABC-type nitrate/sulfonate/bicarbonate transport system permease component
MVPLRFLKSHPQLYGVATVLVVLAAWETSPSWGLIDRNLIPPASDVLVRFVLQWGNAEFYPHLWATLLRAGGGLLLGAVVAIPLGLAMGYWAILHRMFAVTIDAVRPIPASALVPVAILAFGIGHEMYIFVVFFATSIPILLATVDGVRSVDPVLLSTARTLGRGTVQVFRTVLLPAALPHIVTSLRIAIALALIVAVSAEMVLSSQGLGFSVLYAQRMLRIPELYTGVLTLAAVGYAVNRLFVVLENRVIGWHRRASAKTWN